MENYSNTTNNVNTDFTTTTTNAVEITPANQPIEMYPASDIETQQALMSELAKAQGELDTIKAELEQYKYSLQIQREVQNELRCSMADSVYLLLQQLDSDVIADTICRLSTAKETNIIKYIADKMPNVVKQGIKESYNAEEFNTEIEDLDEYIADAYDEGQIVDLIDAKYSWSTILRDAFRRGSVDNSDVVDYLDLQDIVDDELRSGNISFSDMMQHFDNSDCFDHLDSKGEMTWYNVKDYVDMDEVKSDIEVDTDMVTDYISNLSDNEFRTLITNLS